MKYEANSLKIKNVVAQFFYSFRENRKCIDFPISNHD